MVGQMCGCWILSVIGFTHQNPPPVPVPQLIEADAILTLWRDAYRGGSVTSLYFHQYNYDDIFQTETRMDGRIESVSPASVRIGWTPVNIEDRQSGKEKYQLKSGGPKTVHLRKNTLLIVDARMERPCRSIDIPIAFIEQPGSAWGFQQPNPDAGFKERLTVGASGYHSIKMLQTLIFGADLAAFQNEFQWQVEQAANHELRLIGFPKSPEARRVLASLRVILDPNTHRTSAIKFNAPSESKSTVITFADSD